MSGYICGQNQMTKSERFVNGYIYLLLQGLKEGKINILYEGSGDYGSCVRPNRSPLFLDRLTPDQVDLIILQLEQFEKGQLEDIFYTDGDCCNTGM